MSKIDQKENYQANFGLCLRSSSIFYIPDYPIKTTLVLSNYWKFKNNINVILVCNFRDASGKLLQRKELKFEDSNVINISIFPEFTRSCEIEAYGIQNLRIPYSAIMVVYEAEKSISMVHSYTRIYSQMEVEDKKTITDGFESCWTLRDSDQVTSFAVIHNGYEKKKRQTIKLHIVNHKNVKKEIEFELKELNPFETKVIRPKDYFADLIEFLDNQYGSCQIYFSLKHSFTRALLGWETLDKKQIQVTHSNFDYSMHETDLIDSTYRKAHMIVPAIPDKMIFSGIYAGRSPGVYSIKSESIPKQIVPDSFVKFETKEEDLSIERSDGLLPSRIVTCMQIFDPQHSEVLPCECSLGVIHNLRPPKRFHWSVWSAKFQSKIIITAISKIYGDPKNSNLCLRVYSSQNEDYTEFNFNWNQISNNNLSANLDLSHHLDSSQINEEFTYISIFSSYGGFLIYTTVQKHNSFSLEHTF